MNGAAEAKAELRREMRTRLAALGSAERAAASRRAARQLWKVPEIAGARVLLLFAGLADEPVTDGVAVEARRRGIRIAYPRCLDREGRMALHEVGGPERLRPGRWGILEPEPKSAELDAAAVDAALVPGLAWDRGGVRLGRGGGFYDRLFAGLGWRGFRCGFFFAAQELPRIPSDPWDARLDAVVTERETW